MTGEQERNVAELIVPRAGRVEEVPDETWCRTGWWTGTAPRCRR